MASENVDLQTEKTFNEDSSLRFEIQYLKQFNMDASAELQYACKETEELSELLAKTQEEAATSKIANAELKREIVALKEDRSVQEDLASQAKVYASLLETMLDNANFNSSLTPLCSCKKEEQDSLEAMKETTERLQKENKDLHDMMEEFRHMWSKDSKNFQETMTSVKEEKSGLQLEVSRLEKLYQNEEKTHKEIVDINAQLRKEIEMLNVKLSDRESRLRDLLAEKAEFTSDIDELLKDRKETAQQLQQMKENWKIKQDVYEYEISEIKKQKEDATNFFEREKVELTNRIRGCSTELEELRAEYNYSQATLQEQLRMVNSESKFNYDRCLKFETENIKLQQSLEECEGNRERDSELFAVTLSEMEAHLNETKELFTETSNQHAQTTNMLNEAEDVAKNLRLEITNLKRDVTTIHNQKEKILKESDQLREQLRVTLREYTEDREKMEKKQEDSMIAMQQTYTKQIEDIKHNSMLAINQEMIKAQMALDSEKKKYTIQNDSVKKELANTMTEFELFKKETGARIASLNQEVMTVKNRNISVIAECAELKDSQNCDRAEIARVKTEICELTERAAEEQKNHEAAIQDMKEAHRKLVDNMGVEELDENSKNEVEEKNETVEWELVDEE